MRVDTAQRERRRRLTCLAAVLDEGVRPLRAAVVQPLVAQFGMQPIESRFEDLGGLAALQFPSAITLRAIADLYGVDRSYLLNVSSFPMREDEILGLLERSRRDRLIPPLGGQFVVPGLVSAPDSIVADVGWVSCHARKQVWLEMFFLIAGTMMFLMFAGLFVVAVRVGVTVGLGVVLGALAALMLVFAGVLLRNAWRALRLLRLGPAHFTAAVQTGLQHHVAGNLQYYLATSDLAYDCFICWIGNELWIGTEILDRLAASSRSMKKNILREAIRVFMLSPDVRFTAGRAIDHTV